MKNNTISIVIGSWGSYNVCNERTLGSKWLDLSDYYDWEEIEEELKKQGFELDGIDEELFIQDIEGMLTLTGRDCGLEERVPMVGFPYHASDNYFKKIAQKRQLIVVESNEATLYRITKEEPKVVEIDETDESEFTDMKERTKAFESSALCKLIEIFGDELTIHEEDI